MVEGEVKITAADIYDYMLMSAYNSTRGLFISTAGALMIIKGLTEKGWIWLFLGILIVVGLPIVLKIKSRKEVSAAGGVKNLHYLLDDEGVTITGGEAVKKWSWGEATKAVSTNKSIILCFAKGEAQVFPKRDLWEKRPAVIEVISTHMAPNKVKIRQ